MSQKNMSMPLTLFYVYAPEDETLGEELEKHLSLLQYQKLISSWYARRITPDRLLKTDEHLDTASIILLLVSADFLASDYCYEPEVQRALERHRLGETRVIPIILRNCDWKSSPLAALQCLPPDGLPVTSWKSRDEAFRIVAQGISQIVKTHLSPPTFASSVVFHPPQTSQVQRHSRIRMLKQVRSVWIQGLLEQALKQMVPVAPGLQEQPDAVANPWQLALQELSSTALLLPAGLSIIQVYDQAEGELLILGEAGAGKTILLLQLARALLERAEADENHPLPVVFHLSSWSERRRPLKEWLAEELTTKYHVPRRLATSWLATDQILPLLDGLDEVPLAYLGACIQMINAYRNEHGLVPTVVCCRTASYQSQNVRLQLRIAVAVQPLTFQQIDEYLSQEGERWDGLRMAMRADPTLQELATSPLMLSIMVQAYHEDSIIALQAVTSFEARQQLLTDYVQRVLSRRQADTRYTAEQEIHWLSWLAQQLAKQRQTEFNSASIQPDWLPDSRSRNRYSAILKLTTGLLAGIVFGLILGFLTGVIAGLLLGCAFGLIFAVVGALLKEVRTVPDFTRLRRKLVVRGSALSYGLGSGIVSGLAGGLVANWFLSAGAGITLGLAFGGINGLNFGIFCGISSALHKKQNAIVSDRTTRVRNELRYGLLFWQIGGLLLGLVSIWLKGMNFSLIYELIAGLTILLLYELAFGGIVYIQRFSLRWVLWRENYLPWNYSRFLDYATEHILLRKVGNEYFFVHRVLLDYFATLNRTPEPLQLGEKTK